MPWESRSGLDPDHSSLLPSLPIPSCPRDSCPCTPAPGSPCHYQACSYDYALLVWKIWRKHCQGEPVTQLLLIQGGSNIGMTKVCQVMHSLKYFLQGRNLFEVLFRDSAGCVLLSLGRWDGGIICLKIHLEIQIYWCMHVSKVIKTYIKKTQFFVY